MPPPNEVTVSFSATALKLSLAATLSNAIVPKPRIPIVVVDGVPAVWVLVVARGGGAVAGGGAGGLSSSSGTATFTRTYSRSTQAVRRPNCGSTKVTSSQSPRTCEIVTVVPTGR